ncbi:MAG: c-type cytochrome [Alphaproteobacteria bacterium]|nr:c-type cytochrome [Alphaproteobacteria bacterium]MBU6471863.1 c-type cytochrome [Alphaproteobacteria bacterium]
MRSNAALCVAAWLLVGTSATAGTARPPEPNMVAGTCSYCHGKDGICPSAQFPNLAGQTQTYLVTQLQNFRGHMRGDPLAKAYMWSMAGSLSDQRIKRIADYLSSLPPPKGSPGEDLGQVAAGKTIYDQGITSENVPACGACHGPTAAGSDMFPRLAGQHREYLVAQLQAFRSNARNNAIMHGNVEHMTDEQIHEIAAYLASL